MSSGYEKFVAANQALIDCMAKVDFAAYKALDAKAQDAVCSNEANAVAEHLRNDTASFRSIMNERLEFLRSQQ